MNYVKSMILYFQTFLFMLYRTKKTEKEVKKPLPVELLELDTKLKVRNYKIGIIYSRDGQNYDDVMNNKVTSPEFDKFLEHLGDKIQIKGWQRYRADLDTKTTTTGTHSVYTVWEGLEIMFHVSTMLTDECRQRIIGNDIVVIIFQESGKWDPNLIRSQVLHGQIIIQPVHFPGGQIKYNIATAVKNGVPVSRPSLTGKLYDLNDDMREFILQKCVNIERAAWHCNKTVRTQTQPLQNHLWSTRDGLLSNLHDKFLKYAKQY